MSPTDPSSPPAADVAALYVTHRSWLQAWLGRRLGHSGDAADLTHDTFVRLLSRPALPGCREPRAYLVTVAQGLLLDLRRRRRVETAYLEALAAQPEAQAPSSETRAACLELLVRLDAALAGLPAPVREAFLASQLQDQPHAEIAARLGLSVATVKRHIARAIARCVLACR